MNHLAIILSTFVMLHTSFAADRPNVLILFADDWGWGDLACHGHPHLRTPHLDRLAREGSDFRQFTVCSPVCSPSRAALLTGHFPARHRIHEAMGGHASNAAIGMPDHLDPSLTLLPRLFQQAGYATGHFGKWHLSHESTPGAPTPLAYGYDEAAVFTGPGRSVWDDSRFADKKGNAHDPIAAAYHSSAATEHALRFLEQQKDKPFFLNLWLLESHHLVAATEEDKKAYPDTPEPHRTYYSAITRADRLIGDVLALLTEQGRLDDTLILFSSDNGPEHSMEKPTQKLYHSVGSTGDRRGRKRSLLMGGVNVPFIVRWPGKVPAGRVDDTTPLSAVDILPTLCAAANISLPEGYRADGDNALPALQGQPFSRSRPLFWEWRGGHERDVDWPELAMRDGPWTLLITENGKRSELYDLTSDPGQNKDLATAEPERTASMTKALRAWKATLPPTPPQDENSLNRKQRLAAMPKSETRATQDRAAIFKRWDKNNDGHLTLEEYTAAIRTKDTAAERFKSFDRDQDQRLSLTEFTKPQAK